MKIFKLMEEKFPSFTQTDALIYDRCLKFPESITDQSVTEISKNMSVSKAALTRFAKKLGFSGFNEFLFQFRLDTDQLQEEKKAPRSELYAGILNSVEHAVDESVYMNLARRINDSEFVFYTGRHLSHLPAYYLDAQHRAFNQKKSACVHADELYSSLDNRSTILLFSVSSAGSYQYILKKYTEKKNPPYRILVTLSANHPMKHYFNEVIVLPFINISLYQGSPLPEVLSFLMFIDILSSYQKTLN